MKLPPDIDKDIKQHTIPAILPPVCFILKQMEG